MNEGENVIWAESYRPKTIADTILPEHLKVTFQKFVTDGFVPNMILAGSAGVGKTTVARAMLDEIGADYLIINGSLDRNIDTLRRDLTTFASTVSLSGGRKYVILDEADYLNPQSFQPALRNFIEKYATNCGFILTCNFKNKIIEPIHSRCSVIDFRIPVGEGQKLCVEFFQRVLGILDENGVEYDKASVAAFVQDYYPDWRRTLSELQFYASSGKIDEGILTKRGSTKLFEALYEHLSKKDFTKMRKWVADTMDMNASALYRELYDGLPMKLSSVESVAACILTLAEYQYKEAFVADSEINRAAALVSVMVEAVWK